MTTLPYEFDVIVVGAGHAGCEAALACARMGMRTALLTLNCDTVAQMSCNPAIGGVAKGQIVREIDALGGEMAKVIDASGIQFRMLNRSKGPAMHSPRAQADKRLYHVEMKHRLEQQPRLCLRQELVESVDARDGRVCGVTTASGIRYSAGAVILTTGTFLKAVMHIGASRSPGGRAGDMSAEKLSASLTRLGIHLDRLKTGTPARLNGRTVDYGGMVEQTGDDVAVPFSFSNDRVDRPQVSCWMTYTNQRTHDIIRDNLDRAPLYTGQIQSVGPRYCPSIETKVVRFADKPRHQVFLEPEGMRTLEVYCNGISTSLPHDVQEKLIHSIAGLERAEIMRYGYAVEYDYAPPTQLHPTLETKAVEGLYLAGQINGTSGYEEAAGQGLVAGVNAVCKLRSQAPLVLDRADAYIGVMIDDLVTRGVDEPYRMFTSRAEYRLLLRHDNADRRLGHHGRRVGLVDDAAWARVRAKQEQIDRLTRYLDQQRVDGQTLAKILCRPEIDWAALVGMDPGLGAMDVAPAVAAQVAIELSYAGYIRRQQAEVARFRRMESKLIPTGVQYDSIAAMRLEARERFERVRPRSLGQAARIVGITPADIAVLMVHLARGQSRRSGGDHGG